MLYLVLNRFSSQPTFGFTTQPLSAIYICILLQNSRMEQITEHGSLLNFVLIYHHVSWFLQVGIKSSDPTLRNKYINIYILLIYHVDFSTMYNIRAYYTCLKSWVFQTPYFVISHMANIWRFHVPYFIRFDIWLVGMTT